MNDIHLEYRDQFVDALQDYRPSPESIELLNKMPLGIFLGIAGGGRNTIINALVDTGKYHFIVSDTTRPPKIRDRKLEEDGINYYFRSEEDMLLDLQSGKFLEAELIHNQQVSGISMRELSRAFESGDIPINEVDIGGTQNIRKLKPDTTFFFILPPSFEEWMARLTSRESISERELMNRKQTAVRVLNEAFTHNDWHFIINDSLEEAVGKIDSIMFGTTDNRSSVSRAREVASSILKKLTD